MALSVRAATAAMRAAPTACRCQRSFPSGLPNTPSLRRIVSSPHVRYASSSDPSSSSPSLSRAPAPDPQEEAAQSSDAPPAQQDFLDVHNLPTEPSARPQRPSRDPTSPAYAPSDPTLLSNINELTITSSASSITGPATIGHSPAMTARYRPTDRSFSPSVVTPTRGSLTTLQLHRLLSLHAVERGEGVGGVGHLAESFGVDEGAVGRLVASMAVARLFVIGGAAGSGAESEVETVGVRDVNNVPRGKEARVQGHHLVQHLQRYEERKRGGQQT